jgi:hypothetical protein
MGIGFYALALPVVRKSTCSLYILLHLCAKSSSPMPIHTESRFRPVFQTFAHVSVHVRERRTACWDERGTRMPSKVSPLLSDAACAQNTQEQHKYAKKGKTLNQTPTHSAIRRIRGLLGKRPRMCWHAGDICARPRACHQLGSC